MKHFKGRQITNSERCIIVDLDGTLALIDHRDPYNASNSHLDELNYPIAEIVKKFSMNTAIVIVTGRKVDFSKPTLEWLHRHAIPYQHLYMRSSKDNRKDVIVKKEIYTEKIKPNYDQVLFVLDDRNQVVNMWRRLGLTCLQVTEGNF